MVGFFLGSPGKISMKAVVYYQYGSPSVLQAKGVSKPIPTNAEILVRVKASTVSAAVSWVRTGRHPDSKIFTLILRLMFGITKPKQPILGFEFSGVVEEVGKDVKLFRKGDPVYGTTTGLKNGAYAEYVCVPEKWNQGVVTLKPEGLTYEEAAALPIGGMTALQLLRKIIIKKGSNILIYGASGSVGTYAVQLVKYFGATVTAVCSTANIELVKSIGADEAIDYTKKNFTSCGKIFDVVFDAVGKLPASELKSVLIKGGQFVSVKSMTNEKTEYLDFLQLVIGDGYLKPIIDRVYPLEQIVEANEYVDTGHKRGNVVVRVIQD
jgi:NADPH:quinone reductase-like Zn-dependent oxidoreductase